jgi:CheY-like chemotaxis protein
LDTDRRAHPRFPLILAVQYIGAENVLDYTENLSAGGLLICTEREFSVGERVTLVISFPQLLEPVELQVEVIRRRPGGDGVSAGVAVRIPDDRQGDRDKLAEVSRQVAGVRPSDPAHRILLVEDNALVASMYTAALRRLSETDHMPGLAIEVAGDGSAAFHRLLRPPAVDVLVTDLFMPVLSGISLIEKIRSEPSLAGLPVVVVTSGGEPERERLSQLGVALFLRKPVSYQELVGAVRTLIASRVRQPGPADSPDTASEGTRAEQLTDGVEVGKKEVEARPASRR